ncbi:MAG: 5-oxoprolinase subunit PxpB [Pseudomonadota bacterium]
MSSGAASAKTGPYASPRFIPAGDIAMLVELGDAISPEVSRRVVALEGRIDERAIPGIVETVPTYRSILVHYDPSILSAAALEAAIRELGHDDAAHSAPPRRWIFPVAYGGENGIDLEFVARHRGLTTEEVIRLHAAPVYRVYMLGFSPGFAYLGGLPAALHIARRDNPRPKVPAGTVSIGGIQAAICCQAIPSGWHLLGRTPVRTYIPGRRDPFLLAAGDEVRLTPIGAAEFARLEARRAAEPLLPERER